LIAVHAHSDDAEQSEQIIVAGVSDEESTEQSNIQLGPDTEHAVNSNMSRLELDYGTSYRLAVYGQILNPDAEKNTEPVTGLDGQAAEVIIDKYRKSFEKPKKDPVYILNVGSSRK
jgi:type IV pilus biogenesis protein CpaD/CtpE